MVSRRRLLGLFVNAVAVPTMAKCGLAMPLAAVRSPRRGAYLVRISYDLPPYPKVLLTSSQVLLEAAGVKPL
jgi:hypothetical protein